MARRQRSFLHRLLARPAGALSAWLLAPSQRLAAQVRQRLVSSLVTALPSAVQATDQGLVIVQGALALSLADGHFHQQEWELYRECLARLKLSDSQLRSIMQDSPELSRIGAGLAAIGDGAHRLAVGRCYCLFAAADGEGGAAELGLLKTLLEALGHPELEQELPALCRQFRRSESWLARQRAAWGERLARWLLPNAAAHG
ncbi:MAG: hypothetical protein K0U63_08055 [Cyanobacteria bacterium]|nr:hypothetical protein [Cyanobacteriota bacterium]